MAFRRREKPLSPAELKDKIQKEYAESWNHSEPHFGFEANGSIAALSPAFESEITVLFLLDAGDYITERIFEFLQELKVRYPRLPWLPVVAYAHKYLFIRNTKFFERFKHYPIFHTTPVFIDHQAQLDRLYKIDGLPTVVFFNRGHDINRICLAQNFERALSECERILQTALRMSDVGLPLPPVQPHKLSAPVDHQRLTQNEVHPEGNWMPYEGAIVTDDGHATVTAHFEGRHLRLISTLHPQARDSSKLHVTLNDKPVPQNLCGQNLKIDDKGHAVVEINRNSGTYELILSSAPVKGIVKIQFVSVIENPVIFYELRSAL